MPEDKAISILGIVSFKVFPALMGGQKGVADFYAHLSRYCQVNLAVSKDNAENTDLNAQVFPVLFHHKTGPANLLKTFVLKKLMKQKQSDVIMVEHSYLAWLGLLLRRMTGKPLVIHSHNIEAHRFRDMQKPFWWLYLAYERWAHRSADHSFFISEADRQWALENWRLEEKRSSTVTYGTDRQGPVAGPDRRQQRAKLVSEHGLDPSTRLFLFNGTLDYLPNTDALRIIISELLPLLRAMNFPFRIFICGNRATRQWEQVLQQYPELIYKGFVRDISLYFQGTDCFINPGTLGAGIKTKLIDALALNQDCISTESGARGIPAAATEGKLTVVKDYDWRAFANAMRLQAAQPFTDTPSAFYQIFGWEGIVRQALLSLQSL